MSASWAPAAMHATTPEALRHSMVKPTEAAAVPPRRVYYKYKVMEWIFELFWPFAVLVVGMFASISALTIVGQD